MSSMWKQFTIKFQSTLPRGERPIPPFAKPRTFRISIHTPAWGATISAGTRKDNIRISIHTPAWGATPRKMFKGLSSQISIHTPAWGATSAPTFCVGESGNFNPHSRVGSDCRNYSIKRASKNFNPHSRVGSDCKIAQKQF